MAQEINFESVIGKLAELAGTYMGIEKARVHGGAPLAELFDSLCLLELVMLLERELQIDVDLPHCRMAGERMDTHELAHAIVRQHAAGAMSARRAVFLPLPGLVPA